MTHCYQVSLLLEGCSCLVVGGGTVAERKIDSLLRSGGVVRVVAREAIARVRELATVGAVELALRAYVPSDLDGAFLVIAATADRELNAAISADCGHRGVLVNVVDQPALCSFYVPAVIERGPISIAVSSSGGSPALAKRLRQLLEGVVGEEYGLLSSLMEQLRPEVLASFPAQVDRAAAWNRLLDSEVLTLLARGETERARGYAREVMRLVPL